MLDLEGEEVFGSTYISAQAYMEAIEEYSRMRVTEGMLGSIQTEELEATAHDMMLQYLGEEAVSFMPEEEYRSLLTEYMIATDMTELLCAGHVSKNGREIDRFNIAKDMLVDTFSAVVLAITALFPPTSPLVIALGATEGAVAVADGILRVSQGDTVEGPPWEQLEQELFCRPYMHLKGQKR